MNTKDIVLEANSYKPYTCRPLATRIFGMRLFLTGCAIEFEQCEIMRVNFQSDAEEITRLLNVAYAEGRLQELKQDIMPGNPRADLNARLVKVRAVATDMAGSDDFDASRVSLAARGRLLLNYCRGYDRDGKTKLGS